VIRLSLHPWRVVFIPHVVSVMPGVDRMVKRGVLSKGQIRQIGTATREFLELMPVDAS